MQLRISTIIELAGGIGAVTQTLKTKPDGETEVGRIAFAPPRARVPRRHASAQTPCCVLRRAANSGPAARRPARPVAVAAASRPQPLGGATTPEDRGAERARRAAAIGRS